MVKTYFFEKKLDNPILKKHMKESIGNKRTIKFNMIPRLRVRCAPFTAYVLKSISTTQKYNDL
jgi:hypothetical protein